MGGAALSRHRGLRATGGSGMNGDMSLVPLNRAWPLLALTLVGCPKHDDSADPPALGATAEKAAKACHEFVDASAAMLLRTCEGNYTEDELKAELEGQFEERFGGGCDAADGLRDETIFYEECLPGIDAMMECLAEMKAALPESCHDQLQFEAE